MRLSGVVIFSVAALCLAGCSSTAGVDALQMPSNETTSSVMRPSAPVASAPVDTAQLEPMRSAAVADNAPPFSMVEEEEAMLAPSPATQESAAPQAEPIALMSQPRRLSRAAPAMLAGPITRYGFRDAKPMNFGKASPRHMTVHGVDVSRWQGNINWEKLRGQGANFAYIKATDGGDHLDPMFMRNWRNADAAGLKRGAYHFFYWCRTAGEQLSLIHISEPTRPY